MLDPFNDDEAVSRYVEGPPRNVPGFRDMQRMTRILMAEAAPSDARILVLGAGGGLELAAFAAAESGWRFDGVDPSAKMLALAKRTLGPLMSRVSLHEGRIDVAPEGPFDAACCLLTLHFLTRQERLETLIEVRRRLRSGAPFVMAHYSAPNQDRLTWLARSAAFATQTPIGARATAASAARLASTLAILSPDEEETLLSEAGFEQIGLFFAALAFRGWVATA